MDERVKVTESCVNFSHRWMHSAEVMLKISQTAMQQVFSQFQSSLLNAGKERAKRFNDLALVSRGAVA